MRKINASSCGFVFYARSLLVTVVCCSAVVQVCKKTKKILLQDTPLVIILFTDTVLRHSQSKVCAV